MITLSPLQGLCFLVILWLNLIILFHFSAEVCCYVFQIITLPTICGFAGKFLELGLILVSFGVNQHYDASPALDFRLIRAFIFIALGQIYQHLTIPIW